VGQAVDVERLNKILSDYKGKKGALVSVLQKVQEEFGWVPSETIERIAGALKVFPSEVYGVLTFYAQFYLKPRGRNVIHVCLGTACYVKMEAVRCLGACGLAPVIVVNKDVFGAVRPGLVKKILNKYK